MKIKGVNINGVLFSLLEVRLEGTVIYIPLYTCTSRADLYVHCISHIVGTRLLGTASRPSVNIFFILIVGRGKGREMRGRGGGGDGRRDRTVCEGVVPLSDDRIGKAKGS